MRLPWIRAQWPVANQVFLGLGWILSSWCQVFLELSGYHGWDSTSRNAGFEQHQWILNMFDWYSTSKRLWNVGTWQLRSGNGFIRVPWFWTHTQWENPCASEFVCGSYQGYKPSINPAVLGDIPNDVYYKYEVCVWYVYIYIYIHVLTYITILIIYCIWNLDNFIRMFNVNQFIFHIYIYIHFLIIVHIRI